MNATSTSNLHLNASYQRAVARAMERAADGIPACVCCLNPGALLTGETYFVDDLNTDYEPVHVFLPEGKHAPIKRRFVKMPTLPDTRKSTVTDQ
jgi:hypothetical protein